MTRNAVVTALALALTACAQPPCPDGQARDNAGQCVAVDRTQLPEGFVLDAPAPPPPGYVIEAPSKDEYVVDQGAVAEFNRREEAKEEARRARDDAEWRADRRADRIVEAQEDTRRAIEAVDSGR